VASVGEDSLVLLQDEPRPHRRVTLSLRVIRPSAAHG
jgi:hypothetical protein